MIGSVIVTPPPATLDRLEDLLYLVRNADQVQAMVTDLREAIAKHQEVVKASGMLEKLQAFQDGQVTEAQAMKDQAAKELADIQAARAEVDSVRAELAGKKIQADDRLKEAEAIKAEAEAIRVDAETRRKQMLDLVSVQLAKAEN